MFEAPRDARERLHSANDVGARNPEQIARRDSDSDVACVVATGQTRLEREAAARGAKHARGAPQVPARVFDAVVRAHARDLASALFDVVGEPAAEGTVDVDRRERHGHLTPHEQTPLGGAVALHRPVPAKVLVSEVGEHREVRQERGARLELEARHLADRPVVGARHQRRQRRPVIRVAREVRARAGHLADQPGHGRLAVRAGHPHDSRSREQPAQLELVDHLDAELARLADDRRLHRDAGALDQRARTCRTEVERPTQPHVHAQLPSVEAGVRIPRAHRLRAGQAHERTDRCAARSSQACYYVWRGGHSTRSHRWASLMDVTRRDTGIPYTARALGRAAGTTARAAGGGGTALPGKVLLGVVPDALARMAAPLRDGVILVSGTNGKTTTAAMIAAIARRAGYEVVHNRAGANTEWGVATALVEQTGDLAVLEVDEERLMTLAPQLRPRMVVLGNLFRDRLDAYGEVDTVVAGWRALAEASDATFVLN